MAQDTSIECNDVSWNPTRGCARISAGCDISDVRRLATRRLSLHYPAKEPVVGDLFHAGIPEDVLRETVELILAADRSVYHVLLKTGEKE